MSTKTKDLTKTYGGIFGNQVAILWRATGISLLWSAWRIIFAAVINTTKHFRSNTTKKSYVNHDQANNPFIALYSQVKNIHMKNKLCTLQQRSFVVVAMAIFFHCPGLGYGQLLQWNTFGNAGTETTEPSIFNNPNITSANLTQGSITAAGNANRFGGSGWFNTGNTPAGNTLAEAVAGNDYIQFIVTPNTGFSFTPTSFVFQWDKSGTGPKNVALRSSADGFSADLGVLAPVAALGTSNTIAITGLTALTTATTFRIYGYGATATSGTGGFDVGSNFVNVQLNGSTASTGNTSPTVTTQAVSLIGSTSATGNGTITATGGVAPTSRGFCWDAFANPDPTLLNSHSAESGTFGLGSFTGTITPVIAATRYKVVAYATNSEGTGYGTAVSFWTLSTEPVAHSSVFTATAISQTQIDLAFSAASTITNAAGYLILQKTGAAPTAVPTDATSYSVGNDLGDGTTVAAIITSPLSTSASITGLSAGTHYYFTLIPYNWNGTNTETYNYKTNGVIPGTNATTNDPLDATSEVSGPGLNNQPDPVLISSLATAGATAVRVFDMDVWDYATTDSQPTKITQVTIKPGPANIANWANTIQGVKLSTDAGSSFVTIGTPVISTASIVIPILSGNLVVPNNDGITLSLYVYLKSSGLTDNQMLVFKVDAGAGAHGFTADPSGSTFLPTFSAAPVSHQMLIDVVATKLNFATQPSNTTVNTNFSAAVDALDANNNRDLDATIPVTLGASSGTLTSTTGLTKNLVSGLYSWSDLQNNTPATGVTLSATGTLTMATSYTFKVFSAQPLIQASTILFSNVGLNSMTVSWANGNGTNRILVAKASGAPSIPTDGATYAANSVFGTGGSIAPNEFVIYNGVGSSVDVTGLTGSTNYYYKVFEYNGSGGTENYLTTGSAVSQATSGLTYYSTGNGDPAVLTNWKTNRDGTGTSPANFTGGETFVIESGDNMTTTTTWGISGANSKVQIENGGTLTANNAITLNAATTFQIDNGGTYIHNNTTAFGTSIFQGIESFAANSTVEFRDWNTTGPSVTAWGNVKFNATGVVGGAMQLSGNMTIINGNLEVLATGSPTVREVRFATSSAPTITVSGNFTQAAGSVNLASSSGTSVTVFNVAGNFTVNGGTFTSTSTGSKVVFNSTGTQFFTNAGTISTVNFEVAGTSTLNMGTQVLTGGYFTLSSGATLKTAHASGLNGSIAVSGIKTFNPAANYEYNGSVAQVTGMLLPASVNNLTIDNAAGVKLSSPALAVNGNLTINTGKLFTIESGKQVTVNGIFTNSAGSAGLVVNSDATVTGSLIFNTPGVTGSVQRYIAKWTENSHGWHLLSSPVADQAIQPDFVPTDPGSAQDFYAWDEFHGYWFNCKDESLQWVSGFDAGFVPGKGYLVAYQDDVTKTFSGALNVSDVSKTGLTYTPAPYPPGGEPTPGWNLLGNPFASAITWPDGWTLTNVSLTAKVWNEMGAAYLDIGVSSGNQIIPAMQGFMVEVLTDAGGSVTIPAAARTHNAQGWYKSTGNPLIKLVAHNADAQTAQESVVTVNDQSTAGYDPAFDSHFLPGYAPQFYSLKGIEKVSTNVLPGMDNQTTVPFTFIKTNGDNYSIEALQIENVPAQVYLTDLKLNQTQNLGENPVYSFTASDGDSPARFLLSFSHVGIGENNPASNGTYAYENNLYLVNPGKARFEVYSLTGQKLVGREIDSPGLYKTTLTVPTGYYVVRLTTGTKVVITKVFIQS